MDEDGRWARRKALFHEALLRPRSERVEALGAAARDDPALVDEVLRLLEHYDAGGPDGALGATGASAIADSRSPDLLEAGLGPLAESLLCGPPRLAVDPAEFLPYRLRGVLGEGGMGVVFMAERLDLELRVAIKVLRDAWLSPARRRRFLAEERTLAQLTHPCIARILDARVLSDGTPWFAMEYVDGHPITEYCRLRRAGVEERLRLMRAVCEAVGHAHARNVVHRDLKPSNILVTRDGQVRLLDFGIAKRLDAALADDGGDRTTIALMTPAYAAPEQRNGGAVSTRTDVYALGVILHELLTDRRPTAPETRDGRPLTRQPQRPSAVARARELARPRGGSSDRTWRGLDTICLTAAHEDPALRYPSVEALIADIDLVMAGRRLGSGALRARWVRYARRHALRVMGGAALLTAGALAAWRWTPAMRASTGEARPVLAVLPLRNTTNDSATNYLRLAIAEEVANRLGEQRGVVVRDFSRTSGLTDDTLGAGAVGRRLGVTHVVTGDFMPADGEVLVRLQLVDAARDSVVWSDALRADHGSTIDLQSQLATIAHGSIPQVLGVSASRPDISATRPRNERAYQLYLRSAAARYDPGPGNAEGIAMLEEAVTLDSTFAPAWILLSRRYYVASRYETGDPSLTDRMLEASRRAVALDPHYALAGARLAINLLERGEAVEAYRQLQAMLRRRPDSPDVHFVLSYVLRFAGLLRESARECAMAMSIDAHNYSWRSCAVPHLLMGDNASARGFVSLDTGSEWAKAMEVHMLVRSGRVHEALAAPRPSIPLWKSYDLLLACAAGMNAGARDSLAARVKPSDDPETNYFAASHLSYCGKSREAADLLARAIEKGYCAYPVMDTDPLLAPLRAQPEFAELRAKGATCQARFVASVTGGGSARN